MIQPTLYHRYAEQDSDCLLDYGETGALIARLVGAANTLRERSDLTSDNIRTAFRDGAEWYKSTLTATHLTLTTEAASRLYAMDAADARSTTR